jgi:hypothetical protein
MLRPGDPPPNDSALSCSPRKRSSISGSREGYSHTRSERHSMAANKQMGTDREVQSTGPRHRLSESRPGLGGVAMSVFDTREPATGTLDDEPESAAQKVPTSTPARDHAVQATDPDEPQDRLGELEAIIRHEQVQARKADRRSLEHQRRTGDALNEAKELPALKGKFGAWAEREFGFKKQWCAQLMFLSREWKEFDGARAWAESTRRTVGNEFTVDGAVALIKAFKAARSGQAPQPNPGTALKAMDSKDHIAPVVRSTVAPQPPAARSAAEDVDRALPSNAIHPGNAGLRR